MCAKHQGKTLRETRESSRACTHHRAGHTAKRNRQNRPETTHPTNSEMAKPKLKTMIVRLVSTAGTGTTYTVMRRRALPRMTAVKHDKAVNRHVLFVEKKK